MLYPSAGSWWALRSFQEWMLARRKRSVILLRLSDAVCRFVVGIAILVMVVSIFGQVFYRSVLDSYLVWAEEAARFSFVWLVFLGSASAFKTRHHLGIDFIPELISHKGRVILDTIVCVVVFVFTLVLLIYGYRLTLRTLTQVAPATGVTMGYIYMSIPIASALILVYSVVDFFRNIWALKIGDLDRAAIGAPRPVAEV